MTMPLYLIERVEKPEADVPVRYPDGSCGIVAGGTFVEWHVLLADGSRRLVAACHSEGSALDMVRSLEEDAEDFARDWMRNPTND
jgi:hypothetical protein